MITTRAPDGANKSQSGIAVLAEVEDFKTRFHNSKERGAEFAQQTVTVYKHFFMKVQYKVKG